MLNQAALECRRWTAGLPVEVALVVPVVRDRLGPAVAIGYGCDSSAPMPADQVLRTGLAAGADEVIVAHNHPAGTPPGVADLAVTRRLAIAGAVVGVRLRAHLVVTPDGWYDCVDPRHWLNRWLSEPAA